MSASFRFEFGRAGWDLDAVEQGCRGQILDPAGVSEDRQGCAGTVGAQGAEPGSGYSKDREISELTASSQYT